MAICINETLFYNIKMRKIILFLILISIIGTHIYENCEDRLLHKFIYHALKNEDVVFATEIKDVEYLCEFRSFYQIDEIKPALIEIGAKYNPFIWTGFYKHRSGEGTSVVIAVKDDHSIFNTYLNSDNIYFPNWVSFNWKHCIKTDYLHYKIENKKLLITPKSPN